MGKGCKGTVGFGDHFWLDKFGNDAVFRGAKNGALCEHEKKVWHKPRFLIQT